MALYQNNTDLVYGPVTTKSCKKYEPRLLSDPQKQPKQPSSLDIKAKFGYNPTRHSRIQALIITDITAYFKFSYLFFSVDGVLDYFDYFGGGISLYEL